LTCGCRRPNDDHGDLRHITLHNLVAAAQAAGVPIQVAAQHLMTTISQTVAQLAEPSPAAPTALTTQVSATPLSAGDDDDDDDDTDALIEEEDTDEEARGREQQPSYPAQNRALLALRAVMRGYD